MPLLKLTSVSLHFGARILLDDVDLVLKRGDRVGILGRNGEGKTTLLKVISGEILPDGGERWLRPGARVASLSQNLPVGSDETIYDFVAAGLAEAGELLRAYHHLVLDPEPDLVKLSEIQHKLEAVDGWNLQQRVETTLTQLDLPADVQMRSLSGGWRRRAALARALVLDPDILLLDEPTNHLDIPSIEWLERALQEFQGVLLLITHDRSFLRKVTNKIVELDRGNLFAQEGGYESFLRHREEQLAAEEKQNALFDKRLAEEEKWIRQGIKARRTRNEGRVRALKEMREQRAQRRSRQGKAEFSVEAADRSGKIVAELKGVSHTFGDKAVIKGLTTTVIRGDKIGIIGPNGAGKSTLIKIMLGELIPEHGEVKLGTKIEVAYFDQLRQQLEPEKNLLDNICEGREFITINGKDRHGISYLGDFLFTPDRIRTPVKALSGGEQNRAILAKLFSKSANLLVLDEPTNDLDIETLELLEEILLNFEGTVLLVSHDREFMDNVVTSVLVFEGEGAIKEYVGGFSDWVAKGGKLVPQQNQTTKTSESGSESGGISAGQPSPKKQASTNTKKLSYKDQRELDGLPQSIEKLEADISALETRISSPEFYEQEKAAIDETLRELAELQSSLEHCYERWAELEG